MKDAIRVYRGGRVYKAGCCMLNQTMCMSCSKGSAATRVISVPLFSGSGSVRVIDTLRRLLQYVIIVFLHAPCLPQQLRGEDLQHIIVHFRHQTLAELLDHGTSCTHP